MGAVYIFPRERIFPTGDHAHLPNPLVTLAYFRVCLLHGLGTCSDLQSRLSTADSWSPMIYAIPVTGPEDRPPSGEFLFGLNVHCLKI